MVDRVMRALGLSRLTFEAAAGETFSVTTLDSLTGTEIDPAIFGLSWSTDETTSPAPKVSRQQAIQVPAVKRGRDLIAGTIGQLPIRMLDTQNVSTVSSLLEQPEENLARS